LSGQVFAVGERFVAILSGLNNLGRDATDFVTFDFDDLAAGRVSSPIHARFKLSRPTSEYDFEWAAVQGQDLYVVVTETSTIHYRYNPQLWRVELSGNAAPVNIRTSGQGFQSMSMAPVAVSPDYRHLIFTSGVRSGICYIGAWPGLLNTADGTTQPIEGLPREPPNRISLIVDSVQWTSVDSYLLSLRVLPIDCNDTDVASSAHLYRCTLARGCTDTGIASFDAAESRDGDLAYLEPYHNAQRTTLVVQWHKTTKPQRIDVATWSSFAWAP
jgi:hypothetical protein